MARRNWPNGSSTGQEENGNRVNRILIRFHKRAKYIQIVKGKGHTEEYKIQV